MIVALSAIAISSLLNAWYYLPAIVQIWKGGEADTDGVVYSHEFVPSLSFNAAVVCMGLAVILLGCFAHPLIELLTKSVSLL